MNNLNNVEANNKSIGSHFPILTVVQRYLNTVSRGNGCWAVCPFHKDSNPSLSISVQKNIFKCFSCNVSGNALNFVMRMEKCSYVEAIRKIGEILGTDTSKYLNQNQNKLHELCKLNEHVADHYHKCLLSKNKDSIAALNYLTVNRKLSLETIEKYKIGFSPKENTLDTIIALYRKNKSNIGNDIVLESNLYSRHMNVFDQIPFFRDRIIFPIVNEAGNVVGFSGRGDNPKYLHLKNNRLFSKSSCPFNIHNLVENKPIYVFEGFMDLLKVSQELGISNGIACMGGTLSESVFPKIRKYSNQIILCLDNDAVGRGFTADMGKTLISAGFEVFAVNFMDRKEKDVDEMVDVDPKLIKERMENYIPFLTWMHMYRCPKNISDTKKLLHECLGTFLDLQNYSLGENIELNYATHLIDLGFKWYELHSDKWEHIKEAVNEKKQELIRGAENSEIKGGPRKDLVEEARKKHELAKLDNFQMLTLKSYGLIEFMKKGLVDKYFYFDWKINLNNKFWRDETSWFLNALQNPKKDHDVPEFITKYKYKMTQINNAGDFFSKYYTFHQEYLKLLAEEEFSNYYNGTKERLEIKFEIKNEIENVKKVSSDFFRKIKNKL